MPLTDAQWDDLMAQLERAGVKPAPSAPAKTYPAWCCQTCGEEVGYMGRALSFLRFKPFHFH